MFLSKHTDDQGNAMNSVDGGQNGTNTQTSKIHNKYYTINLF